jgi:hypothetical protein
VLARLTALALLAAVSGGAEAQTLAVGGRGCATPEPDVGQLLRSAETVEAYRARGPLAAGLRVEEEPVVVPVAVHVLTDGGEGAVSDDRVRAQIGVLNGAFGPMGYRFVLAYLDRVDRPEWARGLTLRSDREAAMKRALALDTDVYLNLYTASLGLDYLGWATLPDDLPEGDADDGVVLHHETLPGGSAAPFNLGHTGTHEVGHWVGLLHTFHGGCSEPGDGVDDTPQERTAATGCPTARDSCPLDPGEDPVTNFMDYSDDACMTGFTAGQRVRAQALTREHRSTLVAGGRALATVARSAFAGAPVGASVTAPIRVANLTDAPLTVVSATSTNAAFAVDGGGFVVSPGAVASLDLTFTPSTARAYEGAVRLETAEAGELTVAVRGAATIAPVARLATPAVDAELLEGERAERDVRLSNAGGGPLSFAVEDAPPGVASVTPSTGTVPAGGEVTLAVGLSAADVPVGRTDGVLAVRTNDPLQPRVEIPVRLDVQARPEALAVGPPFPNPGRGRVVFPLELPVEAEVTAEVFDVRGRRVAVLADGATLAAGYPALTWDASRAGPGLYVVRVRTSGGVAVGRVTVAR